MSAEQLRAAGADLLGVAASTISMTSRGEDVPVFVGGGPVFGTGSFLELVGRESDSPYSRENVYRVLTGEPRPARVVAARERPPGRGAVTAAPWMARLGRRREYAFASPTGDPWYDTRMMVTSEAKDWTFAFDAEGLAAAGTPAVLSLRLFGGIALPAEPDHHVTVTLNGTALADVRFDGLAAHEATATLPPGLLRERGNQLVLRLPADLGTPFDVVHLQDWAVIYPRALRAVDDFARFSGAGPRFDVSGFTSGRVVAYRITRDGATRTEHVRVRKDEDRSYTAIVPGTEMTAEYVVAGEDVVRTPRIRTPRATGALLAGPAQYLVIAHRDFIDGLRPLLEARAEQGLAVKVADVEDVYARFGHGMVDPEAIRACVAAAATAMGTEYVLLVGGDTYDYRDHLGKGSRSFVPSLYRATSDVVRFAPVDPALADIDDDGVPDVAIGRLPVRTAEELAAVVAKTLAYERGGVARTALLVADRSDERASVSYAAASEAVAERLGRGWSLRRLFLDHAGAEPTRTRLLEAINDGTALVNFVGHSSPTSWTPQAILGVKDVRELGNADCPAVVIQWACWNTYYVSPEQDGLGVALLLSPAGGAAATLGATALSGDVSQNALARHLAGELARPGVRLGAAVLAAKRALAAERPGAADVQYGWTLLGDPALIMPP